MKQLSLDMERTLDELLQHLSVFEREISSSERRLKKLLRIQLLACGVAAIFFGIGSFLLFVIGNVRQETFFVILFLDFSILSFSFYYPRKLQKIDLNFPQKESSPPYLAESLLFLLLDQTQRKALPGDLEEEFRTMILPKFGLGYARFWYCWQVWRSIGHLVTHRFVKLISLGWLFRYVRRWFAS